jgi:V-type H+-transporting ATPase subunit a
MNKEAASGLWRSEDMVRLDIVMQREAAHDMVFFVGITGHAQFVDINEGVTSFMRPFTAEVRRCDEVERKLRYLAEQVVGLGIPVVPVSSSLRESAVPGRHGDALDRLEATVDAAERECRQVNASLESLQRQRDFFAESSRVKNFLLAVSRDGAVGILSGTVPHIAGVVDSAQLSTLVRLAYRVTRGNCILRSSEITDNPVEDARDMPVRQRSCFVMICFSEKMLQRLRRLVESVGATVYNTTNQEDTGKSSMMVDNNATIEQTQLSKATLLTKVASTLEAKLRQVRMEKAIFSSMNLFRFSGSTCQASLWVPKGFADEIDECLKEAMASSRLEVLPVASPSPNQDSPPTYFHTNKYLSIFQGIVDSYGVARYKELNPGVLTIITFPYLFGIMYGDIGHGLLLTLFAGALILFEHRWEGRPLNEIFAMIFGGRYLLFAMGIFAIYIGALYNDFFGFSVGLLPSGYLWPELPAEGGPYGVVTPIEPNGRPSIRPSTPVAFGIDVAWAETENKLEFYNSIKMKCAVIVGVVQMTVGLLFSALNHYYRRDWAKLWFSFVPEIVFLSCTFGYMSLLIILKWSTHFENTHLAPSLLETMTNFFLSPGEVTVELYPGQAGLQVFLLLVAFSMTPVMLLVMPWIEIRSMRRAEEQERAERRELLGGGTPRRNGSEQSGLLASPSPDRPAAADDHHSFGQSQKHDTTEIRIHYIIHTIEFVLGTVSNTASYLRLWALSLAHAQLSEVFFTFGLVQTISMDSSGVMTVVGSAVWLAATVGVLLGMEALSAFLHALRLHWVEFQNKFYAGDGTAFDPLKLLEITGAIPHNAAS